MTEITSADQLHDGLHILLQLGFGRIVNAMIVMGKGPEKNLVFICHNYAAYTGSNSYTPTGYKYSWCMFLYDLERPNRYEKLFLIKGCPYA